MAPATVGVARETTPGERRVALISEAAARLPGSGMKVLIEAGSGAAARFPGQAHGAAGATITTAGCGGAAGPHRTVADTRTGRWLTPAPDGG